MFRSLALGCLLSGVACQVILGIDHVDGVAAPPDAAFDADAATANEAGPTCMRNEPPGPPGDVRGNQSAYTFVVHSILLRPAGQTIGYDIDGLCTNGAVDRPCRNSKDDDDGGVDNSFSNNFVAQFPFDPNQGIDPASKAINTVIRAGGSSALIRVKFNVDQADDLHPTVDMITTPERTAVSCEAGAPDASPPGSCETWSIAPDGFLSSGNARAISAYVSNHVLVARFTDIGLDFGTFAMHVHDALLTATIDENGLTNGLFAGRIERADAIRGAGHFLYKIGADPPAPICKNATLFDASKGFLCDAVDLPTGPNDPNAACDRISAAFGFVAETTGAPKESPPPDGGPDECADVDLSCPQ